MSKNKRDQVTIRSSAVEYLTFSAASDNADGNIEVRYDDENIWLTQKMLAALYDVGVNTVNYHLKKLFDDSEIDENSVIRNYRITASDGKEYNTKHYSLEAILAVGFKVDNAKAVQFRKWGAFGQLY